MSCNTWLLDVNTRILIVKIPLNEIPDLIIFKLPKATHIMYDVLVIAVDR